MLFESLAQVSCSANIFALIALTFEYVNVVHILTIKKCPASHKATQDTHSLIIFLLQCVHCVATEGSEAVEMARIERACEEFLVENLYRRTRTNSRSVRLISRMCIEHRMRQPRIITPELRSLGDCGPMARKG